MREEGVEPSHPFGFWILRPPKIPAAPDSSPAVVPPVASRRKTSRDLLRFSRHSPPTYGIPVEALRPSIKPFQRRHGRMVKSVLHDQCRLPRRDRPTERRSYFYCADSPVQGRATEPGNPKFNLGVVTGGRSRPGLDSHEHQALPFGDVDHRLPTNPKPFLNGPLRAAQSRNTFAPKDTPPALTGPEVV